MTNEFGEHEDVLWGLADYAIHVPLSDKFYQTLPFQRVTIDNVVSGEYQPYQDYGVWTNHMPPSFLIPGLIQVWFGPH